jgi:predicted PhzF superfamily epimerase YddE/YHI9
VSRPLRQVDVFTATPYHGNPVAVVHQARAPYVVSQGTALGRSGRVHISQDADGAIWIGGRTVTCIAGEVEL